MSATTWPAPTLATMTAVQQGRYGPPQTLELSDSVERPIPRDDEVLIKVRAAGVSRGVLHLASGLPLLVRLASGLHRPRRTTPGMDVCGTIVGLGSRVSGLAEGQRVFGIARGSFAEYAVAKAEHIAAAPEALSDAECAVLAESGMTALQALRAGGISGPVRNDPRRVLVLGASGGVGSFAVKLAVRWGANVTAVCSASKAPYVLEWGAERVFDYRVDRCAALADRYDLILDVGGGTPLNQLRAALVPRGTLVFVGNENGGTWTGGYERPFAYQLRMARHRQRFVNLLVRTIQSDLQSLSAQTDGGLRPHLHAIHPLTDVQCALEELAAGRVVGKSALTIGGAEHLS